MKSDLIIVKFWKKELKLDKDKAKRLLVGKFMKTDNTIYLEKLTELMNGNKVIELGGI